MIAAWDDSDSSESEDEEEQATNLCFMANEDQAQEEATEYKSSDEVYYSDLLEYSKNQLAQALIKYIRCEQDYSSKIKSLKKTISNLSSEKECLERSNNATHTIIETLRKIKSNVKILKK